MAGSKTALLVVDMQNDFCHPHQGGLPVAGGAMHLAKPINELLNYPGFTIRIATLSAPPKHHKFLAHNHQGAVAHETHVELNNTKDGFRHQTVKQKLWPAHCEPGTNGHEIIADIDQSKIDIKVLKNQHPDVVMYSGFADVHGNHKHDQPEGSVSHHLEDELRARNITDVYCVGTAGDYCVAHTAIDAAKLGFNSYVVEDVIANFDESGQQFAEQKKIFDQVGVKLVKSTDSKLLALK